jgi:hypothetical protein
MERASRADILDAVVEGSEFSRTFCWAVQAELAAFAHGASFGTAANVGNFYAEGSG